MSNIRPGAARVAALAHELESTPAVLTIGAGAWVEALACVVVRAGGDWIPLRSAAEIGEGIFRNVVAVVVGPPLDAAEVAEACRRVRELGSPAVLTASEGPAGAVEGADASYALPHRMAQLCCRVLAAQASAPQLVRRWR